MNRLRIPVIALWVVLMCRPVSAGDIPSAGEVYGTLVGAGAAITGVTAYLIHRSRTSLSGCVYKEDADPTLITGAGEKYELLNPPANLKSGERVSLRGHKAKGARGRTFRVDRVSKVHGACGV
jgi:hypothetical protein